MRDEEQGKYKRMCESGRTTDARRKIEILFPALLSVPEIKDSSLSKLCIDCWGSSTTNSSGLLSA